MLALTANATEAIHGILVAPQLPDSAGLRITRASAGGLAEGGLQIGLAEAPAENDVIYEEEGARVFVEEATMPLLDDKLLDARVEEQQVTFTLTDQSAALPGEEPEPD